MTHPEPRAAELIADEGPAAPPAGAQRDQEAADRPRSLRLLPRITTDALRLVWSASPRLLVASIALKLLVASAR